MRSYWSCVWYSVFVMSKIKESFTLHIETLWDFISKCASHKQAFCHGTGRSLRRTNSMPNQTADLFLCKRMCFALSVVLAYSDQIVACF